MIDIKFEAEKIAQRAPAVLHISMRAAIESLCRRVAEESAAPLLETLAEKDARIAEAAEVEAAQFDVIDTLRAATPSVPD